MRYSLVMLLAFCAMAHAEDKPEDLFEHYRGEDKIPQSLKATYAEHVQAIRTGNPGRFMLPHAITIATDPRPEKSREYGNDINLPFLEKGFTALVLNARKDPDGCYLIRTGSTAMWFVQIKSGEWRFYRWFDKPIR